MRRPFNPIEQAKNAAGFLVAATLIAAVPVFVLWLGWLVTTQRPVSSAALWSALAATASAIAAGANWRMQRQLLIEGARPDLVMTNFGRHFPDATNSNDEFGFRLTNIGAGPAFDVQCSTDFGPRLEHWPLVMSPFAAAIAKDATSDERAMLIKWPSPRPSGPLAFGVTLVCLDRRGRRYGFFYRLAASEQGAVMAGAALNVSVTHRTTAEGVGAAVRWP